MNDSGGVRNGKFGCLHHSDSEHMEPDGTGWRLDGAVWNQINPDGTVLVQVTKILNWTEAEQGV